MDARNWIDRVSLSLGQNREKELVNITLSNVNRNILHHKLLLVIREVLHLDFAYLYILLYLPLPQPISRPLLPYPPFGLPLLLVYFVLVGVELGVGGGGRGGAGGGMGGTGVQFCGSLPLSFYRECTFMGFGVRNGIRAGPGSGACVGSFGVLGIVG